MKVEIVKEKEILPWRAGTSKYLALLDKQKNLAEGEVLKVEAETQAEISSIYYYFKRHGVKAIQRTRNGIIALYIPKK